MSRNKNIQFANSLKPKLDKNKKPTSKLCQNVFALKDAQLADQKRKEEYLKVVYKKIQEGHEEDFEK